MGVQWDRRTLAHKSVHPSKHCQMQPVQIYTLWGWQFEVAHEDELAGREPPLLY